jgi:uncharacterized protein YkwD
MKQITSIILSLVVSISAAAVSVTDFSDVEPLDWHYRAVEYAVVAGLFNGTSETAFSPDGPMTRGMFVTVLGRAAETPDWYGRTKTTPFNDVTQADYFFPYAVWANDNGIVTGVGGNIFNPDGEISREQIAAILFRYSEKSGYDLTYSAENYNAFADTDSVSDYAENAMRWAVSHGVINGADGKLSPRDNASRAQVAQIFLNFSGLELAEPAISSETSEPAKPNTPVVPDAPVTPTEPIEPGETAEPDAPTTPTEPNTELVDWENYNPEYTRPTGKSPVDADGGYYDYDLANEIMEQVDALRVGKGADALLYHPKIQAWASIRARELTIERSHTRPDGSACLTVGYGLDSENLAWITNYTAVEKNKKEYASSVVSWWNSSESHRLGMLKPSANLGAVSCYIQEDNVYITHLFSMRTLYYMDYLN